MSSSSSVVYLNEGRFCVSRQRLKDFIALDVQVGMNITFVLKDDQLRISMNETEQDRVIDAWKDVHCREVAVDVGYYEVPFYHLVTKSPIRRLFISARLLDSMFFANYDVPNNKDIEGKISLGCHYGIISFAHITTHVSQTKVAYDKMISDWEKVLLKDRSLIDM